MSKPTIKIYKPSIADFLEKSCNKVIDGGEEYYFIPFVFKKVGKNWWELIPLNDLRERYMELFDNVKWFNKTKEIK